MVITNQLVKAGKMETKDLINWGELKQFFNSRPQLSAHGFAKESGVSPRLFSYVLEGKRSLTKKTINKIMPILIRYGYKN